jgi:hypothetical protein
METGGAWRAAIHGSEPIFLRQLGRVLFGSTSRLPEQAAGLRGPMTEGSGAR